MDQTKYILETSAFRVLKRARHEWFTVFNVMNERHRSQFGGNAACLAIDFDAVPFLHQDFC